LRAFFPRVLEHFVGLGFHVRQGHPGQAYPSEVLQAVPQVEQMAAATAQLAGELRGGRALSDTADDQDDLGRRALGALEQGAGPGVEDPTTGTAIVEDGFAVGAVGRVATAAAVGAAEPVGVEGVQEEIVAGLLVEQFEKREVHGAASGWEERGPDAGVLHPDKLGG
jgi:hypothetical protein